MMKWISALALIGLLNTTSVGGNFEPPTEESCTACSTCNSQKCCGVSKTCCDGKSACCENSSGNCSALGACGLAQCNGHANECDQATDQQPQAGQILSWHQALASLMNPKGGKRTLAVSFHVGMSPRNQAADSKENSEQECSQEKVIQCEHTACSGDLCFDNAASSTIPPAIVAQGLPLPPSLPSCNGETSTCSVNDCNVVWQPAQASLNTLESTQVSISVSELVKLASERATMEAQLQMVEEILSAREEIAKSREEMIASIMEMQTEHMDRMFEVVRQNAKLEAQLEASTEMARLLRSMNDSLVQQSNNQGKLAGYSRVSSPMEVVEDRPEMEHRLRAENAYLIGVIQELHRQRATSSKVRPMPIPFASSAYGLEEPGTCTKESAVASEGVPSITTCDEATCEKCAEACPACEAQKKTVDR